MKMPRSAVLIITVAILVCPNLRAQPAVEDSRPHLVMLIAEGEYKTAQTLPPFASANMGRDFRITLLQAKPSAPNSIRNIEALSSADVLLISVRRRPLPAKQLSLIRDYVRRGKPVVAIRTASHAFCLRNKEAPEGLSDWPEFDPEVLGGHYVNHYGNSIEVYVRTKAPDHPIMQGVRRDEFRVYGSLYRCLPLAETTTCLMTGRAEDKEPHEPVAWTNKPAEGNRVFYTSLGHPHDFKIPAFVRMLRNAVYWAAECEIPESDAITLKDPPDKDK